ncbi:MAG TPA: hypothetical protein VEZ44_06740 [bacterium]|nr:hypothetical protein [bacterium]
MQRHLAIRVGVSVLVAAMLRLPPPAWAATAIYVPAGTRVGVRFETRVDSGAVTQGTRVGLRVTADVIGGRHVAIRAGTPVSGIVTEVTRPDTFGTRDKVVIGFLRVNGTDGRPIVLRDLLVSKEMVGSGRAAVADALVPRPTGQLVGALVSGGHVIVPPGAIVTDTTAASVTVAAP